MTLMRCVESILWGRRSPGDLSCPDLRSTLDIKMTEMDTAAGVRINGGAGFIGSNFALHWVGSGNDRVVNVDALTYARYVHNPDSVQGNRTMCSCMETSSTRI